MLTATYSKFVNFSPEIQQHIGEVTVFPTYLIVLSTVNSSVRNFNTFTANLMI
jgi:hypothetical protein